MSETTASLQRKIHSATDLKAVVSTMKAIATISIGQYQDSVLAQHDYYRAVTLGLLTCLKQSTDKVWNLNNVVAYKSGTSAAVIFGSDQGLVGQFNEILADFVARDTKVLQECSKLWVVGERMQARLEENHLNLAGNFALPNSIGTITALINNILQELEARFEAGEISEVYLYHNRPADNGIYEQHRVRLLPLDEKWHADILAMQWPGKALPEVLGETRSTLLHLVHEYLFATLFHSCAESLASENASRLAAMHRAEKNIEEMLEDMQLQFHQVRQSSIDEELFDQVSGTQTLG